TIDSSESRPLSAALCTGTPITGSTVCAATIPGRWAAPPAPAMITSMPRAARRVLRHPGRRAMRRYDACFVRHAEVGEHLVGVAHGVPVGFRAHDHADERTHVVHRALFHHALQPLHNRGPQR